MRMKLFLFLLLIAQVAKADVFHGTGADAIPTEASIPYIAEKGITTIRLQMHVDPSGVNKWGSHQYFMAHHDWLLWFDHLIPIYRQNGIKVILNMSYPPGGFNSERQMPMFNPDHWGHQYFIDMWTFLANKYKDEDTVLGFDLINEPHNSSREVYELQEKATQAIRGITNKAVFQTSRRGRCIDFKTLRRSVYGNVKYTCHVYEPHTFTHQGTPKGKRPGLKYPSRKYPKSKLLKELSPVRKFAQQYGAENVYIGEAAVSIYADKQSQLNWTRDLLNQIRPYNWTIFFVTGHWWRYNVWEPSHDIWMEIYKEFK